MECCGNIQNDGGARIPDPHLTSNQNVNNVCIRTYNVTFPFGMERVYPVELHRAPTRILIKPSRVHILKIRLNKSYFNLLNQCQHKNSNK